jgi:hypothetical protein
MNNYRRLFGTAIAAGALALTIPAMASAQEGAAEATPDAPAVTSPGAGPAVASPADQVNQLLAMGFVNRTSIALAKVDASNVPALGPTPDGLQRALNQVTVDQSDEEIAPASLREYLTSNGIDPSSVVGVQVLDDNVVILYD